MDLVREVGDCDIDQNSPEAIPSFNSGRNGFYRTCKMKLSGGGLEVFEPSSSSTLNRARRRMGLTEQLEPGCTRPDPDRLCRGTYEVFIAILKLSERYFDV